MVNALTAAPALAGNTEGQNTTTADAMATGGTITVSAGHTYWTPPAGSSWAKSAQPDPPPGKPNPNQPYGCTYQPDPTAQQSLGVGGAAPGVWVVVTCAGPGAIDPMPLIWVANPKATGGTVQVAPVVVAEQAVRQLGLSSPVVEMAPPDGAPQLVGVPTWLWIDPAAWRTLTASASAGPVTTTAVATPAKVVFSMGDGDTVTCDGPGTQYDPQAPGAGTDCSYTWLSPGSFSVTATIYWLVTWSATGAAGAGSLGLQAGPPSVVAVNVVESQAINTLGTSD